MEQLCNGSEAERRISLISSYVDPSSSKLSRLGGVIRLAGAQFKDVL